MTNLTIAGGKVALHAQRLAAGVEDQVTFADDVDRVEVISDGSADIYFTVDGSAATLAGANTYRLPAGVITSRELPTAAANQEGQTKVRLISSGTPTYSVTRA